MENGTCMPIQEAYPEPVDLVWVQAVFGSLYAVVMVMGLFGNLLTLYCVFIIKAGLRLASIGLAELGVLEVSVGIDSSFILSLSLSNILMDLTALPFTGIQIFSRIWLFGLSLCRAVPLAQAVGIFVSSFTLVAIAYDRYRQPYCGSFCEEAWPGSSWPRVYSASVISIQFLLPLLVLVYCYGRLRQQVNESVQRRLTQSLTEDARQRVIGRQAKMNKMTSMLFLGFIGPWLPFNLFNVAREYNQSLGLISEDYLSASFGLVHLIAMTSTMWNPIIYCWMNSEFKSTLRRFFGRRKEAEMNGLPTSNPRTNLTCTPDEAATLLPHPQADSGHI